MKEYDATRQRLRELGWSREDRTHYDRWRRRQVHHEYWTHPDHPKGSAGRLHTYKAACKKAGVKPAAMLPKRKGVR